MVATNPPGFHWPPEEGADGFILEISRDSQFRDSKRLLKRAMKKGDLIPESLSEEVEIYNIFMCVDFPLGRLHPFP